MSDVQQRNSEVLANVRIKRDELYESILGLEGALTVPSRGRVREWADGVTGQVGEVRNAIDNHLAVTEGRGGLFDKVMGEAPRLAHSIAGLRREHASLRSQVDEAARRVTAVQTPADVEQGRARLLDLIRALLEHRHRGAELVYEAYDVDLGSAD